MNGFEIQNAEDSIDTASWDSGLNGRTFQEVADNTAGYSLTTSGPTAGLFFVVDATLGDEETLTYYHGGNIVGPTAPIKW